MESTGCYWKPGWHLLEDQVECSLLNAAHMHNVPGRNADDADAAWIAQLVEHGRSSLIRGDTSVRLAGTYRSIRCAQLRICAR